MLGLLNKNSNAWISESKNPNRKLKYTLEIIQDNKSKVGVNTHLTNKIVLSALKINFLKEFENYFNLKSEVKFNKNTRFDF